MAFVMNDDLCIFTVKENVLKRFEDIGALSSAETREEWEENLILIGFDRFTDGFMNCISCMADEALEEEGDKFESRGEFFEHMLEKLPDDLEDFLLDKFIEFFLGGCEGTMMLDWDGSCKIIKPTQKRRTKRR